MYVLVELLESARVTARLLRSTMIASCFGRGPRAEMHMASGEAKYAASTLLQAGEENVGDCRYRPYAAKAGNCMISRVQKVSAC